MACPLASSGRRPGLSLSSHRTVAWLGTAWEDLKFSLRFADLASEVGVIEMSASLLAIVVDCHDPLRQAKFWAQALAYEVNQRNPGEFQVSDPAGGASLYFMKVPEPKAGKNRLHLDLATSGPMEAEVARLAEAGAEVVEVRQDPASLDNPDTWTVMRDPEGHEFCVSSTSTLTGWA